MSRMLDTLAARHVVRIQSTVDHEIETTVLEKIHRLEQKRHGGNTAQIPGFYRPSPPAGSLPACLCNAARSVSQERKQAFGVTLLDRLRCLLLLFSREQSSSWHSRDDRDEHSMSNRRISYKGFKRARAKLEAEGGPSVAGFFMPSTFLKFEADSSGTISLSALWEYIQAKDHHLHLWGRLSACDGNHDGYLTLLELETLLVLLAEEFGHCIPDDLLPRWRLIAPRKIFFYLAKQGRVAIKDLLASPMLGEIARHDIMSPYHTGSPLDGWFTPEKSQAISEKFDELDVDGDGKLTRQELSRLRVTEVDSPGNEVATMTNFFLLRLFEEHIGGVSSISGEPAMSLVEFADFLLAWNSRGEQQSLRYFFKILDLENTGMLTSAVVSVFTRHVAELAVHDLKLYEYEHLDVKDEIFDMVSPKNAGYITIADLAASAMAYTICGILVDGQCYWEYDQREALAQQDDEM